MRNGNKSLMLLAMLLVSGPGPARAADPVEWKAVGKVTLAAPASGMSISEDHRLVYVKTTKKVRLPNGFGVGYYTRDVPIVRCFYVATGKEVLHRFPNELLDLRAAYHHSRYYFAENVGDHIQVMETRTFRKVAEIKTQTANDMPGGPAGGVPLGFVGVSGLISDFAFAADGQTIVVARKANKGWKQVGKNSFQTENFQQFTFWNAQNGKKLGSLDCAAKDVTDARLTLLPGRKQLLVTFNNGVRLLDVESRKWAAVYPVQHDANSKIEFKTMSLPLPGRPARPVMESIPVWGLVQAACSPDEMAIAFVDVDQLRVCAADSGKELHAFKVRGKPWVAQDIRFTDGGKGLRILFSQNTVNALPFGPPPRPQGVGKRPRNLEVYYDVATGKEMKKPASEAAEALKGPWARAAVLAVSGDRCCVVTAPTRQGTHCTVWERGQAAKP